MQDGTIVQEVADVTRGHRITFTHEGKEITGTVTGVKHTDDSTVILFIFLAGAYRLESDHEVTVHLTQYGWFKKATGTH